MRDGFIVMVIGVLTSVLGTVVSVIYLFQPWRSCDYEDTSAGCAMLPGDAAVMMVAMLAIPVGIAVTVTGVVLRHWNRIRPTRGHGRRVGLRWGVLILAGLAIAVALLLACGGIAFLFGPVFDL